MYVPIVTLLSYGLVQRLFPQKCSFAQKQIDSIIMTAEPNIDLSTLREMLGDCLVSSLTSKILKYWQTFVNFNKLAKMRLYGCPLYKRLVQKKIVPQ